LNFTCGLQKYAIKIVFSNIQSYNQFDRPIFVGHKEGQTVEILCFGDSNTWGWDADRYDNTQMLPTRFERGTRWPTVMQAELGPGCHVIENALNGRTTVFDDPNDPGRNGLPALRMALDMHSPLDLVTVMLGTNDTKNFFRASAEDITAGLEQLAQAVLGGRFCAGRPSKLLLISPPVFPPDIANLLYGEIFDDATYEKSTRLAALYSALAAKYGIHFLDAGSCTTPSPIDGVHIGAESHLRLGGAVASAVRSILNI